MKYCLLAVEGYHDQAAVGKMLELSGFEKFDGKYDKDEHEDKFDRFWEGFIPTYPRTGGSFYTRLDMPSIFTSQTHSIAIYVGDGDNLLRKIYATVDNHRQYIEEIHAFGLIVDADDKEPKQVAEKKVKGSKKVPGLKSIFPMISSELGIITAGPPRTGIYVLPNNKESGVLDSVLTDCASIVYPDHKKAAENFLDSLDKAHTKHFRPFDKEKALIACIVSVLKPGKSNTPSITDDKWINHQTIETVNNIRLLYEFLKDLLDVD